MSTPRAPLRVAAISVGVFALSLLSCGREVTAPREGVGFVRRGMFSVDPQFPRLMNNASLAGAVEFERVRVVLRRADGTIALDTMVLFPVGADSVALAVEVPLGASTGASGENLKLSLGYINATGDTVFKGGPVDVTVLPQGSGATPPPVRIPVVYSGAGSSASGVTIAPTTFTGYPGDRFTFTAVAVDAQGRTIPNTPIIWATSDGSRVHLDSNLGGTGALAGARGTARLYAQLLTGQVDSVTLTVLSRAQRLELVSGDNQTSAPSRTLTSPLVVRVIAADGQPAAGVAVTFSTGAGTLVPATATSDASGLASTRWTLGTTTGHVTTTATAAGLTGASGTLTFNAHSVLPRATRLAFENQPGDVAAATTLPALRVAAHDSTGTVVTGTAGSVTMAVTGGAEGARLGGTLTANLVNGVATFSDLSINRAGTGYRLSASTDALTTATSSTFAVTEGAATSLRFVADATSSTAGRALAPMRVAAVDAQGNTATRFTGAITLRIGLNPGGGTLGGTVTRNAVAGVADFEDIRVDRAGVGYTLAATATGLTGGSSVRFDITPAPAARLNVVRGGAQSAPPGTLLDTILVQLTDSLGNPIGGTNISFAVGSGGGSVVVVTAVTDAAGIARARWTLGAVVGAQHLAVGTTALSVDVPATAVGAPAGGPARLFLGFDTLNVTSGITTPVSVFVSPAQPSPVTVNLSTLDTLAQWSTSSVVVPAGASSATASVLARGGSTGFSRVVAAAVGANADTLTLNIQLATVRFLNSYSYSLAANSDTVETQVLLSSPAPAGGLVVSFDLSAAGVVHLAQSPGTRVIPYDPCDELQAARAESAAPTPTAPSRVLEPNTVFIKAGELAAYVYVIGDSAGYVDVTPIAAGYGSQATYFYVETRTLSLYLNQPESFAPAGYRRGTDLYRQSSAYQQSQAVTLTSRTPGIITVPSTVVIRKNQSWQSFFMDAVAVGRTWLVLQAPGYEPDSTEVVVSTPTLKAWGGSWAYVGDIGSTSVAVRDSTNNYSQWSRRGTPLTISAFSRDSSKVVPAVASVTLPVAESSVPYPVRAIGVGSTYIIYTAPGHSPDSVLYSGVAAPALGFYGTTSVGVGQYVASQVYRSSGFDRTTSVTAISSNSAVASVDSLGYLRANTTYSDYFRIVGRSPGASTVTYSATGFASVAVPIVVTTPAFGHTNPCCLVVGGSAQYFNIVTRDSLLQSHPVVGTLAITLASLDATIAKVDTLRTITEGSYSTYAYVYPQSVGTTKIVITSPGYRPDTLSVTVTAAAAGTPTLTISGSTIVAIGKRQKYSASVTRNSTAAAAAVTVSKTGTSTTVTPSSYAPGVGVSYLGSLDVTAGATSGQDVVVVSAAGYVSDTVTLRVGTPRMLIYAPSGTYLANYPYAYVQVYLTDSLGGVRNTADTIRIAITPSDSTVADVGSRTLVIPAGSYYGSTPVTFRGPGKIRFRLQELSGLYANDSSGLTTVLQPALRMNINSTYDPLYVGMRQRTDAYETYVYTDYSVLTNTVVKLTRSTSALVTMPDSVIIPAGQNYVYFGVTGADTVGRLQLTASSPGFSSAVAAVEVTRPTFWVDTDYAYSHDSTSVIEVVAVESGNNNSRIVTEAVAVSLALDSTLVGTLDSTIVTIPAGESYASDAIITLNGSPGRVYLRAWDARAVYRRYAETLTEFTVDRTYLGASPNPFDLGVGQTNDYYVSLGSYTANDVVVNLASASTHTSRAAASADTIPAYSYYRYKSLTGVSQGADTITVSNPRVRPFTWVVRVDSGSFDVNGNRSVKVGQVLDLSMVVRSPGGLYTQAAVLTNISVAATNGTWSSTVTAGYAVCADTASCTSTIAAGGYYRVFRFVPTAAGTARITVTAPGYRSRSLDIQVIP